jgi:ABC-2 type transport system permease protein
LTGARLQVADVLALLASVVSLLAASLSVGFALAGLFVLSRRGNLVANVVQQPIYLLAGFVVPLAALPPTLRILSDALPATHAIAVLRRTSLAGGTLQQTGGEIVLTLGLSLLYWVAGLALLRRVEYVAKRHGTLELY